MTKLIWDECADLKKQLRACKREMSQTWKAMIILCSSRRNLGRDCRWGKPCNRRNCLVLEGVRK